MFRALIENLKSWYGTCPVPPLRLTTHGHLGRFHQQIAQQGVPLLVDMSETSAIAAGFLRRNQPNIAGDLLAAVKSFWSSNHQLQAGAGAAVLT